MKVIEHEANSPHRLPLTHRFSTDLLRLHVPDTTLYFIWAGDKETRTWVTLWLNGHLAQGLTLDEAHGNGPKFLFHHHQSCSLTRN